MEIKRLVFILLGIVLIAFSVGIYSLIYYDGFNLSNFTTSGIINVKSDSSNVKIGANGIEVIDGNDHVKIDWSGIEVRDGNEHVIVGFDGIKVNDGKNNVDIGRGSNWFGINWFGNKNLPVSTLNEEKVESIDNISDIKITSSFIDVKITSSDRTDVLIKYYGSMKSNVVPKLETKRSGNELEIKLTNPKTTGYTVVDSDVVLEVFLPIKIYDEINVSNSSGDINMRNIEGNELNITSSSGEIDLNKLTGKLNLASSSGDINVKEIIGDANIASSSGEVSLNLDSNTGNYKISTSSGDVNVKDVRGLNYRISGKTSSGDITYNGPISVNEDRSGRFEFTIGSGALEMKINTSSGDISFSE